MSICGGLFNAAAERAKREGRTIDAIRLYRMAAAATEGEESAELLRQADACERSEEAARGMERVFPFQGGVVRAVVMSLDGDREKAQRLLEECAAAAVDPRDVLQIREGMGLRSGRV